MTLRRAIAALPDDRATIRAAQAVVRFFNAHPGEDIGIERIVKATGVAEETVHAITEVLSDSFVIDCVGLERCCRFDPSPILAIEVSQYLRTAAAPDAGLRQSTDRFRQRFGRGV